MRGPAHGVGQDEMRWTPDRYVPVLTATPGEVFRAEPFDALEVRTAVLCGDEDNDA